MSKRITVSGEVQCYLSDALEGVDASDILDELSGSEDEVLDWVESNVADERIAEWVCENGEAFNAVLGCIKDDEEKLDEARRRLAVQSAFTGDEIALLVNAVSFSRADAARAAANYSDAELRRLFMLHVEHCDALRQKLLLIEGGE